MSEHWLHDAKDSGVDDRFREYLLSDDAKSPVIMGVSKDDHTFCKERKSIKRTSVVQDVEVSIKHYTK